MFRVIGSVAEGDALDHPGVSALPGGAVIEEERDTRVGIDAQQPPDGSGLSGVRHFHEIPPDVTAGDRRRNEIATLERLDGEPSEGGDGEVGTGAVKHGGPRDVDGAGTDPPQRPAQPWPDVWGDALDRGRDRGGGCAIVPEDGSGWTSLDGGIASVCDLPGALPRR